MFCSSDKRRVYYFDLKGNYIGQLETSYKLYRAEYMDEMYDSSQYVK